MVTHVVVVGAGPGLGAAYAERFRDDGAEVTLLSRKPASLADRLGVGHRTVDAADQDRLAEVLRQLDDEQPIDVLIFNAVLVHPGAVPDLTGDDLREALAVGVEAAWTCVRALLPRMQERGAGALLFTGGGAATYPVTGFGFLSPVKAALRMLVLSLAKALGDSPVHVHTITVAATVGEGIAAAAVADRAAALLRDGGPVEVRLPE